MKEIEDEEVRTDDTSPTDQLYYEEEYDEDAIEVEEIKPPANFTDNLDTVEFGIGNVHLGEEESSPNPYHILLIPSRTNVPSPFDPIDVGLDEIMQNHPRIIDTIIIKKSSSTTTSTTTRSIRTTSTSYEPTTTIIVKTPSPQQ